MGELKTEVVAVVFTEMVGVADQAAELETKMTIPWWSSQRCAASLRGKVSRCRRCRGSSWPMQQLVAVEVATAVVAGENTALRSMPTLGLAVAVAVATAVMAGENSALRSLPTLGLAVVVVAAVATAVVAGENMALRSMPTLGLATEALLNRLARRRGFGLAEARSEIMRRRTNMQSSSPRLQKTKEVDVCGLKRCGRFRGGRRSSRGHESQ